MWKPIDQPVGFLFPKRRVIELKEYAEEFYKSKTWQKCRESYSKSVGGLCEDCMAKGIITPGDTVHHIKHITPQNISNAMITLDWNNLRLVCRDCHAKEHSSHKDRRYSVDENGNVAINCG